MNSELQDYRMKFHVFGAVSSPGCANYAFRQAAEEGRAKYGDSTADTLLTNFYVDDLLKSTNDEVSAEELISNLNNICEDGGLNLTKFFAGETAALSVTPAERRTPMEKQLEKNKEVSVERALGIHWCVENDTLGFRINLQSGPITRRSMLATINSIFDPLGIVSPFVLQEKRILEEIVCAK